MLLIVKKLVPLPFVEAPFFERLVLRQTFLLNFPSRRVLKEVLMPRVAKKTKENFVSPSLASCKHFVKSRKLLELDIEFSLLKLVIRFSLPKHVIGFLLPKLLIKFHSRLDSLTGFEC